MLTPADRVRQSKVKLRLISQREWRAFERGDLDYLPGDLIHRVMLDVARTAYAAGRRDAGK